MADRVIVVGARRGGSRVPAAEIRQMVGRAGRKHHEEECRADIILDDEDYDDVIVEMDNDESLSISSSMADPELVAFHLLPEIVNGHVKDMKTAEAWYSTTLASFQGKKCNLTKSLELLEEVEAIGESREGYVSSALGDIASSLYLNPADVCAWKLNFDDLFTSGMECDDVAVAWALGNVPVMRMTGDFGTHWDAVNICKNSIPPGFEAMTGSLTTIVLWWSITGGPSVGKMRPASLALRGDFGRVKNALLRLDAKVGHWDMSDFFEELGIRVRRGLPSKLIPLCKIEGMGKSLAQYLYNMGVETRADLPSVIENIEGEVDEKNMMVLKEAIRGIR
jgi:replicative superfamily II helicase